MGNYLSGSVETVATDETTRVRLARQNCSKEHQRATTAVSVASTAATATAATTAIAATAAAATLATRHNGHKARGY